METGFGADQHGQNATKAAVRACRNAIEFNSIPSIAAIVPGGYANMGVRVRASPPRTRAAPPRSPSACLGRPTPAPSRPVPVSALRRCGIARPVVTCNRANAPPCAAAASPVPSSTCNRAKRVARNDNQAENAHANKD